jgi:hypothetical protein
MEHHTSPSSEGHYHSYSQTRWNSGSGGSVFLSRAAGSGQRAAGSGLQVTRLPRTPCYAARSGVSLQKLEDTVAISRECTMQGTTNEAESSATDTTAMTVWPSIAAFPLGRMVGQLCGVSAGIGKFFTLGKLMALATIPISLSLFFWRLAPVVARRYCLTDRRVAILKGLGGVPGESISLEDFDAIEVEILTGQTFLRAGDLVFRSAGKEVFRLPGVQHPEGFRQACLRGQQALVAVGRVVAEQASEQPDTPAVAGA